MLKRPRSVANGKKWQVRTYPNIPIIYPRNYNRLQKTT